MTSALDIGLSALEAHRQAMRVTSHNIANAATEGYTRQDVLMAAPEPEMIRPGARGRGVNVTEIRRLADELIVERLRETQSELGRLTAVQSSLTDLELLYNEPGEGGLSNTINSLFATFDDLSNNPESSALRTGSVEQMQTFVSQVSSLYDRMLIQRDQLSLAAETQVEDYNRLTSELANLNLQIRRQSLSGLNPNDLLDLRDNLVREFSALSDARVQISPADGTVRVESGGRAVVSSTTAVSIEVSTGIDGEIQYRYTDNGSTADITGGVLGGFQQLSAEVIPQSIDDLNTLTGTIIAEFNRIHATGTSHTMDFSSHTSDRKIVDDLLATNLDSALHADELIVGQEGIPTQFAPDFTDGFGNLIDRNLTMNVLNTTTGVAEKFTVRWERGSDPVAPGRSLQDLVSAINTGKGGGFSVYPPYAGGVNGVTAQTVAVSDGNRLQIVADEEYSIDFSSALDLRPENEAWQSGSVTVSGTDAALAGQRLIVEVSGGGTSFDLFTIDPLDGTRLAYPAAGGNTVALNGTLSGLTFTAPDTYADGETFAVEFDDAGAIVTKGTVVGQHAETATWTAGSAVMTISGRYTGDQTFDPSRRWNMRVLDGGVVGAEAGTLAPNNPPVVEFTYYDGPIDAPVERTNTVVLDEDFGPGDQIEIADGVFATFGSGSLTTGDELAYTVDAHADQAGLLPALGINTLFTGRNASDIAVNQALIDNPNQLAVARSRSAGDNSNVLRYKDVRDATIFGAEQTTLDDFYQSQVTNVAVLIQQTDSLRSNQQLVVDSLNNRRDDVSGVSIDEEVGRLIMQQQAYTAAARINHRA